MSEQELAIWLDAIRLFSMYSGKGQRLDAHGIFQMAFAACQNMAQHDNHPLALMLTMAMINYHADLWETAHHERTPYT